MAITTAKGTILNISDSASPYTLAPISQVRSIIATAACARSWYEQLDQRCGHRR